jgi:uncharacterized protein YraI
MFVHHLWCVFKGFSSSLARSRARAPYRIRSTSMSDRMVPWGKPLVLASLVAVALVATPACSALPSCSSKPWTAGPVTVAQDVALTRGIQEQTVVILTIKAAQTIYPDGEYSCTNGGDWLGVQYADKSGWVVRSHTRSMRRATPAPSSRSTR